MSYRRRHISGAEVQGMYRRHISGADTPAPIEDGSVSDKLNRVRNLGIEAGRRDAMAKQPSNYERALLEVAAAHGEGGDAGASPIALNELANPLVKTAFRDGYNEGYGGAALAMEAAKPGAQAELMLVNVAESLKIDRDLQPAEFAKWEQQQAAKMTGVDMASVEAALTLGLAALSGVAPKGKVAATVGRTSVKRLWEKQSFVGATEEAAKVVDAVTADPSTPSASLATAPAGGTTVVVNKPDTASTVLSTAVSLGWTAALGASVYHGYKRNNGAFGGTALWFLGGLFAPVIVVPIAIAQGFAKPKARPAYGG